MPARWWSLALVALSSACGGAAPPPQSTTTITSATIPAPSIFDVDVRTPSSAPYIPTLLAAQRPPLIARVTNRGSAPLDVSNLVVEVTAARNGVFFECNKDAALPPPTREPKSLAPGASFAFRRTVDCELPLPGNYNVQVSLTQARGVAPRVVRSYTLAVTAPDDQRPRKMNPAGLWVAVGAAKWTGALSGRGSPSIAIAIVNASAAPLDIPALRLSTRARGGGATTACSDGPALIHPPHSLDAGRTHHETFELECLALGAQGTYDIDVTAHLAGREFALGPIKLQISTDPALLAPPGVWR